MEDYTGKTFGYLKVVSEDKESKHTGRYWICQCRCPKCKIQEKPQYVSIRQDKLRANRTTSCGYAKKEQKTRGIINTNHFIDLGDCIMGTTYKGEKYYFDKEDFELVKSVSQSWFFNDAGYLGARDMRENSPRYNNGRRKIVNLKDVVMNKQEGQKVLFKNTNNKNDMRKSNLYIKNNAE